VPGPSRDWPRGRNGESDILDFLDAAAGDIEGLGAVKRGDLVTVALQGEFRQTGAHALVVQVRFVQPPNRRRLSRCCRSHQRDHRHAGFSELPSNPPTPTDCAEKVSPNAKMVDKIVSIKRDTGWRTFGQAGGRNDAARQSRLAVWLGIA